MTTIKRKHHKHRPLSKLAQRRKKLFLFKIGGVVAALLLIATGVIFGLRSERINIADIDIKGNSALATKALRGFAEEKISGNYVYVLPKSSILLYPRKNLQATLLESFKEIKEVDVSYESLQSISINIEERKPYALYCGEYIKEDAEHSEEINIVIEDADVATSSPENLPDEVAEEEIVIKESDCYFLDEDGFIFTKAPDFSGNVYLRYFGEVDEGGRVGKQFMSVEGFHEINFFLTSLSEIGLNSIIFNILNEDDFEVVLESGGKIMFGQKQNLSDIYENIQSVFGSEEFNEENLPTLDYADFRFGNKVYFKFK